MGRGESCDEGLDIERFGLPETIDELDQLSISHREAKERVIRENTELALRQQEEARIKSHVLVLDFQKVGEEFEIAPIVNPVITKNLLQANMTQKDARTFSFDLSSSTAHRDLHKIFLSLPGDHCYDPEEATQILNSGQAPESNYSALVAIHHDLSQTQAGSKIYGLYNAIASRFYGRSVAPDNCRKHWLIEIDGKNRDDLLIRFFTYGPKREVKFFSSAPNLNLLSKDEIKPPAIVSSRQAQAIYKAAISQGWLVSGDTP